jgi:hypothetical protein
MGLFSVNNAEQLLLFSNIPSELMIPLCGRLIVVSETCFLKENVRLIVSFQ